MTRITMTRIPLRLMFPFVLVLAAILPAAWGQGLFGTGQRGPNKPGPVLRMPDGKPDLEGYWITQANGAPYGVEKHPADFGSFGGPSIVIDPPDGKIPINLGLGPSSRIWRRTTSTTSPRRIARNRACRTRSGRNSGFRFCSRADTS